MSINQGDNVHAQTLSPGLPVGPLFARSPSPPVTLIPTLPNPNTNPIPNPDPNRG